MGVGERERRGSEGGRSDKDRAGRELGDERVGVKNKGVEEDYNERVRTFSIGLWLFCWVQKISEGA